MSGVWGKPCGNFIFADSNRNVGSFYSRSDLKIILPDDLFNSLPDNDMIDEETVYKSLKGNRINGRKVSFDEYLIVAIFRQNFPGIIIEQQVPWGQKSIDIQVSYKGVTKFVEFCGPIHFIKSYKYPPPENPLNRAHEIEKELGTECIIWPYWAQRCVVTANAVFTGNGGLAAFWNANVYFKDFYFENSAEIIKIINSRLGLERNGGIWYAYEKNSENRIKPQHLCDDPDKLIPKGAKDSDLDYWVPPRLRDNSESQ
jgi:hypothetical protein